MSKFDREFESLLRLRFKEHDKQLLESLVRVKQEHNGRGLLYSSLTVVAMHKEIENELLKSTSKCVLTLTELMQNRSSIKLCPFRRKAEKLCITALSKRKAELDSVCKFNTDSIVNSLENKGMVSEYRALNNEFVQLQFENARVELRSKHREIFWAKLKRMRLGIVLVVTLATTLAYLGINGLPKAWDLFQDFIDYTTDATLQSEESQNHDGAKRQQTSITRYANQELRLR